MRKLLAHWWPRSPSQAHIARPDHRPQLAAFMCPACAKRWLAGKSLWHPWCAVELRHGFDLYFERLHREP